ncbi:hypothetical protein TNCV_1115801 [Trichonephila clavipes]|nr:hypothetical protein TNCV_1115801 [Trichonephila clavipes]
MHLTKKRKLRATLMLLPLSVQPFATGGDRYSVRFKCEVLEIERGRSQQFEVLRTPRRLKTALSLPLTPQHRRNHLEWCRSKTSWLSSDKHLIVFSSRVVKVLDRGWPWHEFEPSTTKDPPCRAAMHVKSVGREHKHPPTGVVDRSGGCQLRCRPRHLAIAQNYGVCRQKRPCS